MSSRQASDRHPERRAAHIVKANFPTELNRLRIAAMFAAERQCKVRPRLTAAQGAHAQKLPHALDIQPDDKRAKDNLRALEDMRLRFS